MIFALVQHLRNSNSLEDVSATTNNKRMTKAVRRVEKVGKYSFYFILVYWGRKNVALETLNKNNYVPKETKT